MPPEGKPRKTKRVDQNVMSETSTVRPDGLQAASRRRSPGTRKEDWIANQLRRVYDDALNEDIPKKMLDLLKALEDSEPEGGERG
jgi:hypothetical protein